MSEQFFEKSGKATVVVGGQFGSEAKGAITHHLAITDNYDVAVRGGSDNAGHTVYHGSRAYKMQDIPVPWMNPECLLMMAPAAIFSIEQFEMELDWVRAAGFPVEGRLMVDRNAGVLTQEHIDEELHKRGLTGKIGSTAHGCGAALAAKLMRDGFKTASHPSYLDTFAPFLADVSLELNKRLDQGERAILEGTQGTMLSLNHSPYYPFCTSRDATSTAIANEAGLGPKRVGEIVMVVRSHPIRVGGNSGITGGREMTWEEVAAESGNASLIPERTTVTNRQRRIFEFDADDFMTAVRLNTPTQLALTFADYLDMKDFGKTKVTDLSNKTLNFMSMLHTLSGVPVTLLKTGPLPEHTIDLREKGY